MYSKRKNNIKIPLELEKILIYLQEQGVNPVLVGGCVRDHFLNIPIKDYDIEVFNIKDFETLSNYLEKFGKVKLVGKSFGVLKLNVNELEIDFALPRTETKISKGHQGFEVITNSYLTFKQAAIRRDFTINAIAYDFNTKEFLDPYNGLKDLETKTIRHIADNTFIEDPLRVYRAMQFASRFKFKLNKNTFNLCKKIVEQNELEELAKERVFEELKKALLKSDKPSIFFKLLKELEILKNYPELKALVNCQQEYEYHPEGDVWIHTLMCLDEMAKIKTGNDNKDLTLMLAVLCHDLGKPLCTKVINGKITSYKHESLGLNPSKSLLIRFTNEKALIDSVLPLVQYHLSPFQLYLQDSSQKAVKRLSTKVNIEDLCLVSLADCKGRDIPDKSKCEKATTWLLEEAKKLEISQSSLIPFVLGRDLISLGMKPTKEFKHILEYAFDLQIDENINKEEIIEKIKMRYLLR